MAVNLIKQSTFRVKKSRTVHQMMNKKATAKTLRTELEEALCKVSRQYNENCKSNLIQQFKIQHFEKNTFKVMN